MNFSTFPRELKNSILHHADIDVNLKLLKVSRNVRYFVLHNGPFPREIQAINFEILTHYKTCTYGKSRPGPDANILPLVEPPIHRWQNINSLPYFGEIFKKIRPPQSPPLVNGLMKVETFSYKIEIITKSQISTIDDTKINGEKNSINLKVSSLLDLISSCKNLTISGGHYLFLLEAEEWIFSEHFRERKLFAKLDRVKELSVDLKSSFNKVILENLRISVDNKCKLALNFAHNDTEKRIVALKSPYFRPCNHFELKEFDRHFVEICSELNTQFLWNHFGTTIWFQKALREMLEKGNPSKNRSTTACLSIGAYIPLQDDVMAIILSHQVEEITESSMETTNFWDFLKTSFKIEDLNAGDREPPVGDEKYFPHERAPHDGETFQEMLTKRFFKQYISLSEERLIALIYIDKISQSLNSQGRSSFILYVFIRKQSVSR